MRCAAVAVAVLTLSVGGCGGGCGVLEPLPEPFPAIQRVPDLAQVQITPAGIDALEADPEGTLLAALGGPLELELPSSCGDATETCCTNGTPDSPCGPLSLDLALVDGDDARLVVQPVQGASRIDVTVRARATTPAYAIRASGVDCTATIDTAPGAFADLEVIVPLNLVQDAPSGTTRVAAGDVTINRLEEEDVTIGGGGTCPIIDFGLAIVVDTLRGAIADRIQQAVAAHAELGVTGRLVGDALWGDAARSLGAVDVYQVAGGTATTNGDGLQLWFLGGLRPIGGAEGRCGPGVDAPSIPEISKVLLDAAGDDLVLGVHAHQLARFAYAAYQGGFLCQTLGGPALTSDALLAFVPSLGELVEEAAPVEVGLRPQAPPVIALQDGAALEVSFAGLEVDVTVEIERQPVRLFTVVADATLPVTLAVDGGGALAPDLGAIALDAVSVTNVQGVTESPAEIAGMVEPLVAGALEELASIGPIPLPPVAGVPVRATGVATVNEGSHLAITADFAPSQQVAWFALLLLLLVAGLAPACGGGGDDDGDSPCGDVACEPGEVERGPIGRWSSVAADAERTLVATYDHRLGDLVVVLVDGEDLTYTAVDGVPDEAPIHDGGYRGGIAGEGPDRGAWTSIALAGARAQVAYQDRDAGALRVAREDEAGWTTGEIEEGGAQAAIAVDGDGAAVIAHVVEGAAGDELRLARADGDGWDTRTLAAVDQPRGVDSPDVAVLDDGRVAVVYGDRSRGALVLLVEDSPGGDLGEVLLAERGRRPTMIADGGTLHVAYQDPRTEDLLYLTWDGAPGAVEVVDDGARPDDRAHTVGAGAAIYLRTSGPRIVYQDGTLADVLVAERDDVSDTWSHETLASGEPLDGFHLDATSPGVVVWDWLRADDPDARHNLEIRTP